MADPTVLSVDATQSPARAEASAVAAVARTARTNEVGRDTGEKRKPETAPPVEEVAESVETAIEKNGRELVFGGRSIRFTFDRDLSKVIVKVLSQETDEVIRQIPPEDYLQFIARFREQIGVLLDESA